jgi:hypothetical protein
MKTDKSGQGKENREPQKGTKCARAKTTEIVLRFLRLFVADFLFLDVYLINPRRFFI